MKFFVLFIHILSYYYIIITFFFYIVLRCFKVQSILNRINDVVDKSLISYQTSFIVGKLCTGQILNLTQNIENEYEKKLVTGAVFIDLSAAYDTIYHRILGLDSWIKRIQEKNDFLKLNNKFSAQCGENYF